jgi:hypothetical protein
MLHRARALWCCGSRRPPPRAAKDARGKTGPDIQIDLLDLSEKCPKLAKLRRMPSVEAAIIAFV